MSRTRAARVCGPDAIELDDFELPPLQEHQVRISVTACGICGTNLHHLSHPHLIPEPKRSNPGALGHEVAGRVAETGAAVTGLGRDDLVVVEPQLAVACGTCRACTFGAPRFCEHQYALPMWGFAETMIVNARGAWPVPLDVDDAVATLLEPLAVSIHAIRVTTRALTQDGRIDGARVAVLGAGVTGLLTIAAATHLGASEIAVLARYPHQAVEAQTFGATSVVMLDDAPERALRSLRPDIVVECVGGAAATLQLAGDVVAPMGEVSVVGLFDELQPVDTNKAFQKETRFIFPVAYSEVGGHHDYQIGSTILAGMAGQMGGLVTHRFPLGSIGDAFDAASDKRSGAFRVVVEPSAPPPERAGAGQHD